MHSLSTEQLAGIMDIIGSSTDRVFDGIPQLYEQCRSEAEKNLHLVRVALFLRDQYSQIPFYKQCVVKCESSYWIKMVCTDRELYLRSEQLMSSLLQSFPMWSRFGSLSTEKLAEIMDLIGSSKDSVFDGMPELLEDCRSEAEDSLHQVRAALRLREWYGEIPFYAQRAEKYGTKYWISLSYSAVNV